MTDRQFTAVFADGDGVADEASAAAFDRARQALAGLRGQRVGVVFCSLRTRAELEQVHQELELRQPFIAEGGAAAFIPAGYFGVQIPEALERAGYDVLEFGPPYADTVRTLHETAARLGVGVEGFSDMSVEAVAEACGLPLLRARLATLREYVEPFQAVAPRTGRARLHRALEQAGLAVTTSGAFDYVGGSVTYAPAVRALRRLYDRAFGPTLSVSVAVRRRPQLAPDGAEHQVVLDGLGPHGRPIDIGGWADGILRAVAEIRERQDGMGRQRRASDVLHINQ